MTNSGVCPKCGRTYKKFIYSHLQRHIQSCPGRATCACGCGEIVKTVGHVYAQGHNRTGCKQSLEEIAKRAESIRNFRANESDEHKAQTGTKISATKMTPEGNKKVREAYQKCRERVISKLRGRTPWNKMSADELIDVHCLQCGRVVSVPPSIARTRKYCSQECQRLYRTGRPMEHWNPNSALSEGTGSGVSGKYRGVLFRSTYELSFLVQAAVLGDKVQAEPFIIPVCDYLSQLDRECYQVKSNQRYIPDYLLNDTTIVEIKPEYCFHPEYFDFQTISAKMVALKSYCKQHNFDMLILTDEDMGEFILTTKQIREIPQEDIVFFKEKHRERYKMD